MRVSTLFEWKRPEIRALHLTWIAFYICFFVWFGMAPLASSMLKSVNWLTPEDLKLFAIANVALTIPARILVGMALDHWGPRRVFSVLLVVMAVPALFFAFGDSRTQLLVSRLILSSIGASFVVGIHMTAMWFKPKDIGFAEGFYAGWGNFGSAAAAMSLPAIAIHAFGGPEGWRWAIASSAIIMAVYGVYYWFALTDGPAGTVHRKPHKASALVVFPDVETCCLAVPVLKQQPVSAVELLDRRSLRSVEHKAGMPEWVKELSPTACALLIESRDASQSLLHEQVNLIMASIAHFPVEKQVDFSEDPVVYNQLWKIRKDTFPAVGAVRQTGTTVIIEDVTFPVERLAEGVNRLIELLDKHRYDEAILFGHALEGNLHFVFTQGFDDPAQVARYEAFMGEVAQLVAVEFGGALKAEHGTGRNMAPFVELEWGSEAYALMWKIKRLLDPTGILNPDVVLSEDPDIHLKNLKPMPAADEIVDKCIECGFCEPVCPSNGLTLTPRQRIVIWRDIQARKRAGVDTTEIERLYHYHGVETCAATGLCAQRCPVGINTGDLVRKLRGREARSTITAWSIWLTV